MNKEKYHLEVDFVDSSENTPSTTFKAGLQYFTHKEDIVLEYQHLMDSCCKFYFENQIRRFYCTGNLLTPFTGFGTKNV